MSVIPIKKSKQPAASTSDDSTAQSLFEVHQKIYPRAVTGVFANWRIALVLATQLVFYGLPWLELNGRQAVLFDLVNRKFYILGLILWPQDFIFLTGILVLSALSLFLFTAIAGRLWCGYACPQTVYTEIFLWIERRIEGDRMKQMKRDAGPWTATKVSLKAAKHAAWIALALWTGFTFVGYFSPIRTLAGEALTWSLGPWETFWLLFYAFATYGNAGWMREQVCKYMCPYARFQGVMFDPGTLVITYDQVRGEPRGARSKSVDPAKAGLGACVDCGICVQVCPTGIDIRRGQQYECIGCAACIDGCNQVMDKMGYDRGLIRYSSQATVAAGLGAVDVLRHALRPRTIVYATLLGVVAMAFVTGLLVRVPLKVDIIRDRGTLARETPDGRVENVYRFQVMNTDDRPHQYVIAVTGLPGGEVSTARPVELGPASARMIPVEVRGDPHGLKRGSNPVRFSVQAVDDAKIRVEEKSVFFMR